MLRSAASLFRVGGLASLRSPNCSGLLRGSTAIPLLECALRERSADASSLLDRLREHSARAAGRRSVHHKFARQKLAAVAAAVSLQQQNKQQPQQQVAPSPREQLLLNKMTEKHAIGRGMPAKMQRRRMKLRVYNAEFQCYFYFREEDVEENSILGRGPGGQATNRRRQTCQIAHKPTGIRVRFSRFRSLYSNRKMARTLLSWQIEKKLFGVFSRLGAAELRQKLRERRHRRTRAKLLRMGMNAEAAASAAPAGETTANEGFAPLGKSAPGGGGSGFPLCCGASYFEALCTALPSEADRASTSDIRARQRQLANCCRADVGAGFYVSICRGGGGSSADDVTQEPRRAPCTAAAAADEHDDGVVKITDLVEPPFADAWWSRLSVAWESALCLGDGRDDVLGIVPLAPPAWFCLVFPVFPTSPVLVPPQLRCEFARRCRQEGEQRISALPAGSVFVGPRDAWEGHERSYIKSRLTRRDSGDNKNSDEAIALEQLMRRPYVTFFEMFGVRATLSGNPPSARRVAKLECDVALNWFEGRSRLCFDAELTSLLWTHVLRSALEFGFDDIVVCTQRFLDSASATEKHEAARETLTRLAQLTARW